MTIYEIEEDVFSIQVFWIRQQLRGFGIKFDFIPILCDNTTISISRDPAHHSFGPKIKTIC